MKSIRVLNRNGKVCTTFDVRDPVSIELEYQVLEEGHHLSLHIYCINEMGHVLFTSKDNLDSPWRDTTCPAGHYRSVCNVPGDFLNEGEVSIDYRVDDIGVCILVHAAGQNVVRFRVTDKMDPAGVRGNFPLEWSRDGVRPRLHWTVEKRT
jgi:hypothetical protein